MMPTGLLPYGLLSLFFYVSEIYNLGGIAYSKLNHLSSILNEKVTQSYALRTTERSNPSIEILFPSDSSFCQIDKN